MSKERLEEIETKYSTITITSERDGIEYTEIDVKDLVFLIQNGFKQAKRAEELEENNRTFRKNNKRLRKENKRYREALEFYASKETYEHVLRSEAVYENGICISPLDLEPPVIYFDKGEIARKELEGESE